MHNVQLRQGFLTTGMTKSRHYFLSLLDEDIISGASRMGVSQGKSKRQALAYVESNKDVELDRTLTTLEKKKREKTNGAG
jgi:hypothetical protein